MTKEEIALVRQIATEIAKEVVAQALVKEALPAVDKYPLGKKEKAKKAEEEN